MEIQNDEIRLPLPDEEERAFTERLKKRLRRCLFRLGFSAGAAIAVLLTAAALLLPRLGNCLYYRPGQLSEGRPQAEHDLNLYAELCCPAFHDSRVFVRSLGFGKYLLSVCRPDGVMREAFVERGRWSFQGQVSAAEGAARYYRFGTPLSMERFLTLYKACPEAQGLRLWLSPALASAEGLGAFWDGRGCASGQEAEARLRLEILSLLNELSEEEAFLRGFDPALAALLGDETLCAVLTDELKEAPLFLDGFYAEGPAELIEAFEACLSAARRLPAGRALKGAGFP